MARDKKRVTPFSTGIKYAGVDTPLLSRDQIWRDMLMPRPKLKKSAKPKSGFPLRVLTEQVRMKLRQPLMPRVRVRMPWW